MTKSVDERIADLDRAREEREKLKGPIGPPRHDPDAVRTKKVLGDFRASNPLPAPKPQPKPVHREPLTEAERAEMMADIDVGLERLRRRTAPPIRPEDRQYLR